MRRLFSSGIVAAVFLTSAICGFGAPAPDFHPYVYALSSENDANFSAAVRHLREIPNLDAQLEASLASANAGTSDATQVIRALRETALTDAVIAQIRKTPDTDLWITLYSLLTPQTQDRISAVSAELLASRHLEMTDGSIVTCLSILSSTTRPIVPKLASDFLNHESYEVRMASLEYSGKMLSAGIGAPYLPLVATALEGKPYQLRLKALTIAESLPPAQLATLASALKACRGDPNVEVRRRCQEFPHSGSKGGR